MWGQLAAAGVNLAGGFLGKSKKKEHDVIQPREYEEAEGARKAWFQNLMKWGGDADYGAISPDWENIWAQASQQVTDYFQGTPGGKPGVVDKMQAEMARRGTSDTPAAMKKTLLQTSAEEGRQLKDLASQQSISRAQFGESARLNWLNSLQQLSSLQAPQATYLPQQYEQNPMAGALGELGGSIAGYFGQKDFQNWMTNLYGKPGMQPDMVRNVKDKGLVSVAPPDYYKTGGR